MASKQQALTAIDRARQDLCALSDAIWDHPEVGYHETFAAQSFCDFLTREGFRVDTALAGIPTAFCGVYGSGSPVVGILAEFDALGGLSQEAEVLERRPATPDGAGHGCGHNLLGVGSLAAALAVKEYLASGHSGTVKFFGCPAEEGGAGKGFMARDGVFDGLDLAFSWHPGDTNNVNNGSTLANYQVCYHFKGKSSHAAISPELGRSALDAVELMNVGVQFLREHVPQECRIHYAITNSGGNSPGVVQPVADVLYLMRAPQLYQVKDLYQRVNDIAQGAALMTGTQVEIEFIKACSNILNNQTLGMLMQKNLEELGGASYDEADRALAVAIRETIEQKDEYFRDLVQDVADPELRSRMLENADAPIHDLVIPYLGRERTSAASSDVGDVSWVCPVAQISMVTMPAGTGMHSWQQVAVGKSAMAKKGMLQAGRVIAAAAIDALADPEIVRQAQQEKAQRTGGRSYDPPIPKDVRPRM